MSSNKKYGEETEMVSFRVPVSKKTEIKQIVKLKLNEYEKMALTKESEVINDVIPKWKQEVEKKLNPTDEVLVKAEEQQSKYDNLQKAKEIASKITIEPKIEHLGYVEYPEKEVKDVVAEIKKDKIKVLQEIADTIKNGGGVKSDLFAKKKVNIDEEYEFEYVKSIPDQDDQIVIDKKGLAFYSKYDLGVFYVKWEGKYMRFDSKAEFDRFGKEYLTLI